MTRGQIREALGIRQIEDPAKRDEELDDQEAADYKRGLLALWPEKKKGGAPC